MNPYSGANIDIETAVETKYEGKYPRVLPSIRNDHSAGGASNGNASDINNNMGEFSNIRQSYGAPVNANSNSSGLDIPYQAK